MILRFFFIFLLLTGLTSHSYAGKVYKWIDENGATQYSQKPPPSSVNTSSEVNVGNAANIMKPEKRGKHFYCGDYKLQTSRSSSAASKIVRLQENILNWQREKERRYQQRLSVTKSMNSSMDRSINRTLKNDKYNRGGSSSYLDNYNKQLRSHDRSIAQIDCKIKWAQTRLDEYADEKKKITERYESTTQMLAGLNDRKIKACGDDKRVGVIVVDNEYRAYQRCISPFDREIRRLKRESNRAKRDYESVQGW